jgi:Domain of unknown function (DUF4389)
MKTSIKSNITRRGTWLRALYMLLFAVIYNVTEIVLAAVVLLQFFLVLLLGESNQRLLAFGKGLSTYVYQIFLFLTYNSEEIPFPFNPWPTADSSPTEPRATTVHKRERKDDTK